jgi:DNA-binding SARP family transcriptional activator
MAETLHLALLGGLPVARGGEELRFVSRKAQALLAYLAVTGRPRSREALAGLLWGGAPEARAAGNLRVTLSNLRRVVPDHVLITRRAVAFDRQSDCWLDVAEFEQQVTSSRRQDAALAAELYRGDFLEGFYVRDAPLLEEWVLAERERLRQMVLQALHRLVAHHSSRGEYAAGIEHAIRLLALDPWREEAHRELMRLLALSGQRSAALAQYETCRRLLEAELGLEPMEETTALYARIREVGSWGIGQALPSSPAHLLPFAGRGGEHAALVAWWEAARRGEGSLALVEGEAGVGKTRLVEEVTHYIETRGATVLRGRCYEFGTGVPYQPIAKALRSQIERRDRESLSLLSISPVWLSELSRLLPELRQRFPDLPPPVQVSGEAARQRLFEAVAQFLSVHSAHPLFLFLDDLHWADPSTLDLLHYLVRRLADTRVWIVGAYRPEEVDLDHPLTRLRQGLSRDHLVSRLALEPLPAGAVLDIARSLVGEAAAPAFGDFLRRESEGYPFILAEVIHDLRERGALRGDEAGAWHWSGPLPGEVVPESVRDIVLQRVGRLARPARRLLMLAAVVGQAFDLTLLQAAAGPDVAAVEDSLAAWLTRRPVHPAASSKQQAAKDMLHSPFSIFQFPTFRPRSGQASNFHFPIRLLPRQDPGGGLPGQTRGAASVLAPPGGGGPGGIERRAAGSGLRATGPSLRAGWRGRKGAGLSAAGCGPGGGRLCPPGGAGLL